jgi:cytoskeletal protein CcmA (bactofilin family)
MKIKKYVTGILVFVVVAISSAMVINNKCEEKDDGVTNVSGNFDEDYLFLGNELRFSGSAEDIIFLGKRMNFEGTAKLGLISLCKDLIFTGEVGNGIIAAGMNINIDGKVKGNNFILCKTLRLSEKTAVEGNLFSGCAKLIVDGVITGDLYIGAGEIVINNLINGNVKAYGGRIVLGKNGRINGDLTYAAKEKLKPEDLQKISGKVEVDEKHKFDTAEISRKNWLAFKVFLGIAMFVSFLIIGNILLILPAFSKLESKVPNERSFWQTGLWGLIPALMYPALIVINFILIVTIPLAFVLILAAIPLFFITQIIGLTLLGRYVVQKFKWNITNRHIHFLIGALLGSLLSIVPVVNVLVTLFLSGLGWGIFIAFLFNKQSFETQPGISEGKNGEIEPRK